MFRLINTDEWKRRDVETLQDGLTNLIAVFEIFICLTEIEPTFEFYSQRNRFIRGIVTSREMKTLRII